MHVEIAISQRRSIRRFLSTPVSNDILQSIINAGLLAPSPKNRQPWQFVVAQTEKQGMLKALQTGIEAEKSGQGLLPNYAPYLASAQHTFSIMEQAPATIFVLNSFEKALFQYQTMEENFTHSSNVQAIGACIENMILTAQSFGLGSLWIGDIDFAYRPLLEWLQTDAQLVAALSIGYPDETPRPRPRKELESCTQWR